MMDLFFSALCHIHLGVGVEEVFITNGEGTSPPVVVVALPLLLLLLLLPLPPLDEDGRLGAGFFAICIFLLDRKASTWRGDFVPTFMDALSTYPKLSSFIDFFNFAAQTLHFAMSISVHSLVCCFTPASLIWTLPPHRPFVNASMRTCFGTVSITRVCSSASASGSGV